MRAEQILDALERLLAARRSQAVSLPMIAREARIPLSSIYHLFPSAEAAFTGLVRRYNAQMDLELSALLAGPWPARWQDMARTLLAAVRAFYARHPVVARLVLNTAPHRAARDSDDAHVAELAARFAREIERRFQLPAIDDLAARLAIAMAISDRIWSLGVDEHGTVAEFHFEESVRAVVGYLSHYLPPGLAARDGSGA